MKTRSGRKRTAKARKNLLDEIHRLSCGGFSQSEIARKLELSQAQISRDLKTIARLRSPQDASEKTKRRARLLAKMQHAEKELWAAWELSKQDKETSTKEKVLLPGHAGKRGKSANERNKVSIRREGRLPNSSYMAKLNKIWDRECKIFEMNEPEKRDVVLKQIKIIETVRPAPKPGETPPTPPTLTTPTIPTSLTQPVTIAQTGQPNGPDGPAPTPPIPPISSATTDVAPTSVAPPAAPKETAQNGTNGTRGDRYLIEFGDDGGMRVNFHPGQLRAWDSLKRFVCVLSGTQGGKTEMGPPWLYREIQARGPGDYMIVTPTFPLLELKALPAFKQLFETGLHLGEYQGHPLRKFTFNDEGKVFCFGENTDEEKETIVYFGHASDPESLESATAKAVWLDEAGQKKFRLGSFEAILRRLSIHMGRVLITTTPYDLGWIKQRLYDPWEEANHDHPEIDIMRFDSTENPAFPKEEFERARRDLPLWKFNMFYRAMFSRAAGLIYDCCDPKRHKVPRFTIPPTWHRMLGIDFGGISTSGIFLRGAVIGVEVLNGLAKAKTILRVRPETRSRRH